MRIFLVICWITMVHFAIAQPQWASRWITHPDAGSGDYAVLHFRNSFYLEHPVEELKVHVSADIRYKLYLNGEYLGEGPANNDLRHYSYDTYDLADRLLDGRNVLAAVVWTFGDLNPLRYESDRCRLILMAENDVFDYLNTGSGNWKVFFDNAYTPTYKGKDFEINGYYAMGCGESIEASSFPWDWEKSTFDDREWLVATALSPGKPYGFRYGYGEAEHGLLSRSIPMMDRSEEMRPQLRALEGMRHDQTRSLWQENKRIRILANAEVTFLFDQEVLTKGHPTFIFSKGKAATVEVAYAENLFYPDGSKGNRNEISGKHVLGVTDRYVLDGGENRAFSPLLSRTWRYLQVKVKTGKEPVVFESYEAHKFIYPFEQKAQLDSGNPLYDKILEVGWRTARLCADETYMDTPYYEQLQYIGDTRIQALISLYYSGDDRLMRNALTQFSHSMTDEGITQSRFPSSLLQYIPPYSLYMINMVHDYHMHRKDDAFTAGFLNNIATILYWFEDHLRNDMLLGPMPWWSYVDAIDDFEKASPPGSWEGGSVVLTLQFIYALQDAVKLFSYHGKDHLAQHFARLQVQVQEQVKKIAYDSHKKLFADTPDKVRYSQHANILAILTNTAEPDMQTELFNRLIKDTSLAQANLYFQFYLIRAAQHSGNGDYFINHLSMWENMLNEGLTTYAEHLHDTRSDCHAWSASPNYEFFNTVLGIQPSKAHFEEVLIEPNVGHLKEISGKVPHPNGVVEVSLVVIDDRMQADVILPVNTKGIFRWKGADYPLKEGSNHVIVRD